MSEKINAAYTNIRLSEKLQKKFLLCSVYSKSNFPLSLISRPGNSGAHL